MNVVEIDISHFLLKVVRPWIVHLAGQLQRIPVFHGKAGRYFLPQCGIA